MAVAAIRSRRSINSAFLPTGNNMISPKAKLNEERPPIRGQAHGLNHPEVPAMAWRHRVPVSRDNRTMEQKAIDRWENEGGEIPHEQQKQTASVRGAAVGLRRY
jgi:hypothetical protein